MLCMGVSKSSLPAKQRVAAAVGVGLVLGLLVWGCSSGESSGGVTTTTTTKGKGVTTTTTGVSTTGLPFDPADYPVPPVGVSVTVAGDENLDDKLAGVDDVARVTALNFMGTALEELPPRVGELTGVTHMVIEGNADLKALPAELGELPVVYLVVQDNPSLEQVPEEICQLDKLALFTISSNAALNKLPGCMAQMGSLKRVNVFDSSNDPAVWAPLGSLENPDLFFLFAVEGRRTIADLEAVAAQLPEASWLVLTECDCPENAEGQYLFSYAVCGTLFDLEARVIPSADTWDLIRDYSSSGSAFLISTVSPEEHWICVRNTE